MVLKVAVNHSYENSGQNQVEMFSDINPKIYKPNEQVEIKQSVSNPNKIYYVY